MSPSLVHTKSQLGFGCGGRLPHRKSRDVLLDANLPCHLGRAWSGSHPRLGMWPISRFGNPAADFPGRVRRR